MTPRKNLLLKCLGLGTIAGTGGGGYVGSDSVSSLLSNVSESFRSNDFGIPNWCNGSCDLTQDDLKKIKFKGLDNGEPTSVTDFDPDQKITLTISQDNNSKKYIFTNSGKAIELQRDSKTLILRPNGTTAFTEENGVLSKSLGSFGLPNDCIANKNCSLTHEDLGEINFKGFSSVSGEVNVTPFKDVQTVTMRIEEPGSQSKKTKYIFSNNHSSPITISKSTISIVLEGNVDNVFVEDNGSLKKIELVEYGIPKECLSSPCQLDEDDLKEIRFPGMSEGLKATVSTDQKVTLTVLETSKGGRKYLFKNTGEPITIQSGSETIILNGEIKFAGEGTKLKRLKVGGSGLPQNCENQCALGPDDLEEIKFKNLDGQGEKVTVTNFPDSISLTIKDEEDHKRYIFKNSGGEVNINSGSQSISFRSKRDTRFKLLNSGDGKLEELKTDDYGLPSTCSAAGSTCTLTEDDLKEIKFKDLGDGEEEVKVENFERKKISLKIVQDGSNTKKYIFTNNSTNDVTISKGSSTPVTLNKQGKTRFTNDNGNNKLKKLDLGKFGLPSECETNSSKQCTLTQDDLEQVKFDGLNEDKDSTVEGFPTSGNISLKIVEESGSTKKYVFSNESDNDVKIKKSSTDDSGSITLKKKRKSKYSENDSKLKKLELNDYGLPKTTCETNCELTADDLEDVKFQALGDDIEGDVTVTPPQSSSGKIVTLKIETDENSQKKYIFTSKNSSGGDITIKRTSDSSKTLTIKSKGETKFSEDNQKLKTLELGEFGLPQRCSTTNPCSLSEDDLKDIKFKNLGDAEDQVVTVKNFPDQKISLKIETIPDSTNKKYIFTNNSSNSVEIEKGTGGSNKVTLENGKTRFVVDSTSDPKKLTKDTLSSLNLPTRCTSVSKCKLTEDDLEQIKFEKLEPDNGGQVTVTGLSDGKTVTLEKIKDSSNKDRYVFSNDSEQEIKVKKGDDESKSITIKAKSDGKTRFEEDNNKLKEITAGNFGLPSNCISQQDTCCLVGDDLEQIKFDGFEDKGDATVSNLASGKKVSLKIDSTDTNNKKYIFTSPSDSDKDITIQKGSASITLNKGGRKTKFSESSGKLKPLELGNYGLPKSCDNGSSCSLTQDDLENVKFEGFEDDKDSTVVNFPTDANSKISIKIITETEGNRKRYIFDNTSNKKDLTISRGTKSVTLNKNGKASFRNEGDKLKEIKRESNGVPSDCKSQCNLYEDDLEQIKFKALEDNSSNEKVTVSNFPEGKSISLKIVGEGTAKKYIFDNSSGQQDIEIKLGSDNNKKVTLSKGKKTKFSEENGKLKSFGLQNNGLPSRCGNNNPCTLTSDDLEDIKFDKFGEDSESSGDKVTVTGLSDDQTITLNIETIQDTTSSGKKKYIFINNTNSSITIKKGESEDKTVTLKVGKTRFTDESNKLKDVSLQGNGLPDRCKEGSDCKLSQDDLEQIKFTDLDGEGTSVTGFSSGGQSQSTISLKIVTEAENNGKKRYIFNNELGEEIKIEKTDSQSVSLPSGKTRFSEENNKLKKFEVGDYNLPKTCSTSTGTECSLIEDDLDQIKFSELKDGVGNVTVTDFPSSPNQIKLKIDSSDENNKRYIFTNNSDKDVVIKKGSSDSNKVTLKKKVKTRFKVEEENLKEIPLDSLGLPGDCKDNQKCTLDKEDMEHIKFSDLGDDVGTVTVESWPDNQTITMKIDGTITKKYIFINNTDNEIKIKKGSDSNKVVTLEKQKKNKFVLDESSNNKLKKLELGSLGLPKSCDTGTSCNISEDDLKEIKFQEIEDETATNDEVKVTNFPSGETITLTIDSTDSNNKKYKFDNKKNSNDITIQRGTDGSKKVTLTASKETTFKVESEKLKKEDDA